MATMWLPGHSEIRLRAQKNVSLIRLRATHAPNNFVARLKGPLAPMQLLPLMLLSAAPWTLDVHPALEAPWSVEKAAPIDDAWVGLVASRPGAQGVFVARPPEAATQLLEGKATAAPGMGFSLLTESDGGVNVWRVDLDPEPRARAVTRLPRAPQAFSCARQADVCAWVSDGRLVIASGDLRTEQTWDTERRHRRSRGRVSPDEPEMSRSVALEDVENLGVSPDGELVALQFHDGVVLLATDGSGVQLAIYDLMLRAQTVPEVKAALEQRIATAKGKWFERREGCRMQIEGWTPPHMPQLFLDQLTDPGASDCGIAPGPVQPEFEGPEPLEEWTWRTRDCSWVHVSGASLGRFECGGEIDAWGEERLPFALALSPNELLIGEESSQLPFWYVPPSRQKPFTRVHLEAKEGEKERWRVVTFGGAFPNVQVLTVPHGASQLRLSLESGWHLFDGRQEDDEDEDPRHRKKTAWWIRFVRAPRRQVAAR
jgi:hypothetical protein